MHDFSIVAIFKGEGRHLIEWIEYHALLRADHFYLYTNDCARAANRSAEAVSPYVARGLVTLDRRLECRPPPVQEAALRHAATHRASSYWLAHIDIDEFIVLADPRASLPSAFATFRGRAAMIALPWRIFGTSGHRVSPAAPVIASYTRRAKWRSPDWRTRSYKSVVHGGSCLQSSVHSCARLKPGVAPYLWTPGGCRFAASNTTIPRRCRCHGPAACVAWLNHYRTKSEEDWAAKRRRGRADAKGAGYHYRRPPGFYNVVSDDHAVRGVVARIDAMDEPRRREELRRLLLGDGGGHRSGRRGDRQL